MPWSCSGPGEGELPDCGPVNKFSMQILHTAQIFQLANSQWCSLLLHKVSWIFFLSPHQFECGPTPEHFKRNKKYAVIVWPMCIIIYCLRNRSAFLQYWLQFRQYWKHIQNAIDVRTYFLAHITHKNCNTVDTKIFGGLLLLFPCVLGV